MLFSPQICYQLKSLLPVTPPHPSTSCPPSPRGEGMCCRYLFAGIYTNSHCGAMLPEPHRRWDFTLRSRISPAAGGFHPGQRPGFHTSAGRSARRRRISLRSKTGILLRVVRNKRFEKLTKNLCKRRIKALTVTV